MVGSCREFFVLIFVVSNLLISECFIFDTSNKPCLPKNVPCQCKITKRPDYRDASINVTDISITCEGSSPGIFPDFSSVSLIKAEELYVGVEKNNLTYIPGGAFTGFRPLNSNATDLYIGLSENRISKIENNAFAGLENMFLEVDLRQNNLTELPIAFLMVKQLRGLFIHDNPIKTIDPVILQHIALTLIYVEISFANVSSWPSVYTFNALNSAWLHDVQQHMLPQRPFHGSEKILRNIAIYGSDFTMLPCILTDLTALEELILHQSRNLSATNLIEECRPNYTMSSTVNKIHLVEGALTEFPNILKYTPMLSMLNLYRNQIKHVNEDYIPVNTPLTDLMLSYNQLQTIPNSFLRFQHLKRLILDNNNIATVQPSMERAIVHFQGLSFCVRDNPINNTNLTMICLSDRDSWAY